MMEEKLLFFDKITVGHRSSQTGIFTQTQYLETSIIVLFINPPSILYYIP